MKKLMFWVICLVFGFASASYGMQPKHQPNFERLAEEINVTEDQMDGFIEVMQAQHSQRKEIHEQERDAAKEKMDALRDGMLNKLAGILTAEQMVQLREKMEKRKQEKKKYRLLNAHRCCTR